MTQLGYPTTPEQMRDRLGFLLVHPDQVTLVAETDHVVGVAGGGLCRNYENDGVFAQLAVLVVHADAQGAGVGHQLVEAVESWARDHGAVAIGLTSGLHREGAHAFYESCGYTRTGYRFRKVL